MFQKCAMTTLFAFLLTSQFALADIHKLLNSPNRPTIADVLRELSTEELMQDPLSNIQEIERQQLDRLPEVIAELEWAYPGAIYMPLGRDSVVAGDIIDAFYHSQGQPGRVIRLNASGKSLNVSEEMIARFVQSSGVDIKNLASGPSYIFFDGSRYSLPNGSQSTKILTAVYKEYVRLGGQAKNILTKFNFFNLVKGHPTSVEVGTLERNKFLREQTTYLGNIPHAIPDKTFASSVRPYGGHEWHSAFELLTEMPDSSVASPLPKYPNSLALRQEILASLFMIIRVVEESKFIDTVQARAKELGYDFKLKQNCDQVIGAMP